MKEIEELGWVYNSTIDGGDLYIHNKSKYPIDYYLMYSGEVIDMYMSIHNNRSYGYHGELKNTEQLEQLMQMLNII